jgi:hypothetical protein
VVIRRHKSQKERQHNDQNKKTKGQTTIYKTFHKKLKIEQPIPLQIMGVNSGVRRVALVTNLEINHECGKDRIVITTKGTHPCIFVTQIPCNE